MTIALQDIDSHNIITFDRVISYMISKQVKYPYYDIPSKKTPTMDTDAFSVSATKYTIKAMIDDAEKATLVSMIELYNDHAYVVDDKERPNKNVRLDTIDFAANVGYTTDDTWIATITLTAEDH